MPELHTVVVLTALALCQNKVSGCELLSRFDMPSLFRQGDIMIGGIFPVFNKDISSTSTFESKPQGAQCSR